MLNISSYKGNEPYIFISYAHKDINLVHPIIFRLQSDGYRVWFDEGIDPGTEWDESIAESIDECGYFLAFISKNYLNSDNCKDELKYARDLSKKSVLVYLEDVPLTRGMAMRMNRIQSIYKHKYHAENDFYAKFYESDGISSFTSKNSETVQEQPKSQATTKTITFKNGTTYTGQVNSENQLHGHGAIFYPGGNIFEGEFKNDVAIGHGIFRSANGDVFEGEYKDNKSIGHGILRYANGDVFEGEYEDGKRNGHGILRYANGDVFEGEYEDDKFIY